MKIAIRNTRPRTPPRNVRAAKLPPAQDHDLPILAAEQSDLRRLDWEELMSDGVQPALLIGGERRTHGRR